MKKMIYTVAALSLAVVFSCQKANETIVPETKADVHTLSVAFPAMTKPQDSKVSLSTSGQTQWEVGDKLVIFGQGSSDATRRVVHEIVADDIKDDPKVAIFDVDFSNLIPEDSSGSEYAHAYNVVFPYTEGQKYYSGNPNYGRSLFQNTNQLLMAGYVTDDLNAIVLSPLTAAVTFSVSGDFDSYVFSGNGGSEAVGYTTLMVEMNSTTAPRYRQKYTEGGTSGPLTSLTGSVNGDGVAVHQIFLPVNAERSGSSPDYSYDPASKRKANVVYLPDGFTIQLLKGGEIKKYITASSPLIMEPGHMVNLGLLPDASMHDYVPAAHASTIPLDKVKKDLGADKGTANCYFINPADAITNEEGSIFKFEAVKGNGDDSVGNIASVEVLWRTFNNATTPGETDVVKAVDYDETGEKTYIVFQLPDSPQAGNAVIAAKNAVGAILWSWHIWVPSTPIATIVDATNLGPEMMTRNLGALKDSEASESNSVESFGFLYQWGRKDPFPGIQTITAWPSAAKVYGTGTNIVTGGKMSIDESVANPTKLGLSDDSDWATPSSSHLWESDSKTLYDPCPPGYKVPAWDNTKTIWSGNLGLTAENYNTTYGWFKLGDSVFPFAAYYNATGSPSLQYGGQRAMYWSATADPNSSSKGYCLFQKAGSTSSTSLRKRYVASVRCAVIAASE